MEKKREVEVEEYWRTKEQELGEPILFKSISHTYHSDGLESFGVLFASASFVVFEYSKAARRSILEVLFSRREQGLTEQVKIPRADIRALAIVAAAAGRRWLARGEPPSSVQERLGAGRQSSLGRLLGGSAVCLCTDQTWLLLDTPSNKEWLALLRG